MDTNVIVNDIKKSFKIFHFFAKFMSWSANAHYDEKNFWFKILCFEWKLDSAMRYVVVGIQKLVFSSKHTIVLLKTNFLMPTLTYLKSITSDLFCKQKILH